jgi:hypothetical protein
MYIDFASGEAILARHEEETQRHLDAWYLRRTARQARQRSSWLYGTSDRLRCELDYQRLALAERLARFDLAQSVLRADRGSVFSTGPCS